MSFDDLPTRLGASTLDPWVVLLESIGNDQDTVATRHVNLLGLDRHGDRTAPLRARGNGLPIYSCERWVQLRMVTTATISACTIWLPNYDPESHWDLRIGTTSTYRAPVASPSDIAHLEPATAEPGLPISLVQDQFGWTSEYLVLQATWNTDNHPATHIQPAPIEFSFSWTES